MNCQRCGTINDDSALFCRECGAGFSSKNVMDAFPELKFMPTTISRPKSLWSSVFWYNLFCLVWLFFGVFAVARYFVEGWWDDPSSIALVCFGVFVIPVAIFRFKLHVKLPKEIEYVSLKPKMRRFPFVVINNKIGVFDMKKRKITIPCEYDSLTWFMVGKILIAKHPEKGQIRIDICNNELK